MEAQLMAEANLQHPKPSELETGPPSDDDDITLADDEFLLELIKHYPCDKLFAMVIDKPDDYKTFTIVDKIIRTKNLMGNNIVCIPCNRDLVTCLITQAHDMLGHFGPQRTVEYIRRWYWWPLMSKDIREFCKTCEFCN